MKGIYYYNGYDWTWYLEILNQQVKRGNCNTRKEMDEVIKNTPNVNMWTRADQ